MLVLTETALDAHDVQRLATLHAPEEARAHVVIPSGTDQSTLDQIVDDIARTDLDGEVARIAGRIAQQPRLALQLAKQACNHMETLQGKNAGIDAAFGYHHFAHANNTLTKGDYIAGFDGKAMAAANKKQVGES